MYDKFIQDKINSLFKLFISKNNSAQGVWVGIFDLPVLYGYIILHQKLDFLDMYL